MADLIKWTVYAMLPSNPATRLLGGRNYIQTRVGETIATRLQLDNNLRGWFAQVEQNRYEGTVYVFGPKD